MEKTHSQSSLKHQPPSTGLFLRNVSKPDINNTAVFNNPKLLWAYCDADQNLQVFHSVASVPNGIVGFFGDSINGSNQTMISVSASHWQCCIISITNRSTTYITLGQLHMTGKKNYQQVVVLPKSFQLEVGEIVPRETSFNESLPENKFLDGFKPWHNAMRWAATNNKGYPITNSAEGTIFHVTNLNSINNVAGFTIIQAGGPTHNRAHIYIIANPISPYNEDYKNTLPTMETSTIGMVINYLFSRLNNASDTPQQGISGININVMTTIM